MIETLVEFGKIILLVVLTIVLILLIAGANYLFRKTSGAIKKNIKQKYGGNRRDY